MLGSDNRDQNNKFDYLIENISNSLLIYNFTHI